MGHGQAVHDARFRLRHGARARYGIYDFQVVDVKLFLKEVAAPTPISVWANLRTPCVRASSAFSRRLSPWPKFRCSTSPGRYDELGEALLPVINPAVISKYGIQISSFIVENVSLPPEVEQSIDKRSSMAAVGNLNDYIKFQMAESLAKGEGGGLAGAASQLGAAWPWASKSRNP